MIPLAKRNLKIFFRDRASVFFSLLSVLIVIGLYMLFLGDVMQREMSDFPGARYMMDSWIMAGVLAVGSLTTTLGAFGRIVEDRENKIIKDFLASPMRRFSQVGGYILGAMGIGVIMSVLSLAFAEVYILGNGGSALSPEALLKTFGLILLSVVANGAMGFFLVSLIKSQNAFATLSTIIGTFSGFLAGIYMPIGNLPPFIQSVVKVVPVAHAGVLFRQVMMEDAMRQAFQSAPAETVMEIKRSLGIVFQYGGADASPWVSVAVLATTTVAFFGLSIVALSRKAK